MNTFKLFTLAITMVSGLSFAQSGTYEIKNKSQVPNVSAYEQAMDAANFNQYHYQSERRILEFEDGIIIELLSLDELEASGIDISGFAASVKNESSKPTYKLHASGYILEVHQATKQKQ